MIGGIAVIRFRLPQARVAGEEETSCRARCGPPKRRAILIAIQRVLRGGRAGRRPSLGVQRFVAKELEHRAAILVGPRLGHDVDDAGRITAVFGPVTAGDDAEFLDRLRVRRGVAGAAQAGGVVAAIELEIDRADLRLLRAVDRRRLFGAAERVRRVVAGDTAGDAQQRIEVAIDERQIEDLVLAHGARQRGGGGLNHRRTRPRPTPPH